MTYWVCFVWMTYCVLSTKDVSVNDILDVHSTELDEGQMTYCVYIVVLLKMRLWMTYGVHSTEDEGVDDIL